MTSKRDEARRLYVREGRTISEIAAMLAVSDKTVYRWRTQDAQSDEQHGWDRLRRLWHMSPRELIGLYTDSVKAAIIDLSSDPSQLADVRTADAISKHVANIQRLNPTAQYLGIAIDLVRQIDAYLAEHAPELRQKLVKHWEPIKARLVRYYENSGA